MIRNLKMLGLALVAVFALSATVASAASAANDLFTSSSPNEKTDLTGESTLPTFTSAGVPVVCNTGTYRGTIEGAAVGAVTVHPVYETNCLTGGTFPTTVDTQGCDYLLTGDTDANGHATAHIECTSGEIKITVFGDEAHTELLMTIGVPPQTVRGIHYDTTTVNGHNALTVTATVEEEVESSCTGEFCFLVGGEGALEPADYTDDVTTTGWEDTGSFTRNSTTHEWSGSHGSQVNITDSEE